MKISIVIDESLRPGLAANCTAVLGAALGARYPDINGPDTKDRSGLCYPGITTVPIPILRATRHTLADLTGRAIGKSELTFVILTDLAQQCRTYTEYERRLGRTDIEHIAVVGLCLLGDKSVVDRLTGSLPLYR